MLSSVCCFFKQKTAYEMRISDWSSDVCSSDLVVRLAEGDMDRATVYGDNPAQQATLFAEAGAGFLHVVDLDGAFAGRAVNAGAVESIIEAFPGHVQLGGGIRERAAVERWFDLGVSRVVIGTAALKDPEFVKDAAREFPGGIVVAVDARDGFVATEGWAERSDMPVADMARRFEDAGRSEEHTSELQSLMRISYAVFCLKKKTHTNREVHTHTHT